MDDQYKQHTEQVSYVIQPLKNHLLQITQRPNLASSYLPEYFQYVELCRLKLELAQANFHGNRTDQEIQSLRQKIRHFENTRPAQTNTSIYRLFLDVLESRDMLTCLDTLHTDLRQERKQAVSIADLAGNLPIHNNLTLEVLWRNVIVCSRYQSKAEQTFLHQKYFDYIQAGYPFELIDGDNFALPYEFLSEHFGTFQQSTHACAECHRTTKLRQKHTVESHVRHIIRCSGWSMYSRCLWNIDPCQSQRL